MTLSEVAFYANILRFVAGRSDRSDPRVAEMMDALVDAAGEIEARGALTVPAGRYEITARAFAGVAGFLLKQILPEAVAHGNAAGEAQLRWAVDASMEMVNRLLSEAALGHGDRPIELRPSPGA
ncbi:MAG: hypothetical protein AB1918_01250 [Pseudomonadota bacterium]